MFICIYLAIGDVNPVLIFIYLKTQIFTNKQLKHEFMSQTLSIDMMDQKFGSDDHDFNNIPI
jgi:hypothetical protein